MKTEHNFYNLSSAQKRKEIILESEFPIDFFKVLKNEVALKNILNIKVASGKNKYDRLDFNDGVNFVVSEKFIDVLTENNLTGWKTYDIEIERFNEKYWGFQIVGKCGKLKRKETRGFHKGYEFNYNSWDENDFFCPKENHLSFISERAMIILKKSGITNIEFENVKEVEYYSLGKATHNNG